MLDQVEIQVADEVARVLQFVSGDVIALVGSEDDG